jgi:hypothetical protein
MFLLALKCSQVSVVILYSKCCYGRCLYSEFVKKVVMLSFIMLCLIMRSFSMLSFIILSVILLKGIVLNVVTLSCITFAVILSVVVHNLVIPNVDMSFFIPNVVTLNATMLSVAAPCIPSKASQSCHPHRLETSNVCLFIQIGKPWFFRL